MKLFTKKTLPSEDDLSDQQEPALAFEKFINDLEVYKRNKKATTTKVAARLLLVLPVIALITISVHFFTQPPAARKYHQMYRIKSNVPTSKTQTRPAPLPSTESIDSRTPLPEKSASADQRDTQSAVKTTSNGKKPGNKSTTPPLKPAAVSRVPSPKSTSQPRRTKRISKQKSTAASNLPKKTTSPDTPRDPLPDAPTPEESEFSGLVDRTAFYMPAGSDTKNPNNRRQPSNRTHSGKFRVTTMSPEDNPAPRTKLKVISQLAQKHEGVFGSTLEHNGDYYKIKLFIPEAKLGPFKKAIAQIVEYASFTRIPEESTHDKICVILETHMK